MAVNFETLAQQEDWRRYALPAEQCYSDELPYHNWSHALHVAKQAVAMAADCQAHGVEVSATDMAIAAAWHDAGYQDDHRAAGCQTKEQFSALLAGAFLTAQHVDDSRITEIKQAIIGTTHGVYRRGWNMLFLHRADISGIGAPYEVFVRNSNKLWREEQILRDNPVFTNWQTTVARFIGEMIDESEPELRSLRVDEADIKTYLRNAQENIRKFKIETPETLAGLESSKV